MFCQPFASSLPLGDGGPERKCVADLTPDTVAMSAQTGTLAINCCRHVPNGSKPDHCYDPVGHC